LGINCVNVLHDVSHVLSRGKVFDLVSHALDSEDSVEELVSIVRNPTLLLEHLIRLILSNLELFILLVSKEPSVVLLATTLFLLSVDESLPLSKFGLKSLLTHGLVLSLFSLQFLGLAEDVLSEDLSHASVHLVNSFTAAGLFTLLLLLLALALLVNSALEHSSTHLRHLLGLFISDGGVQVFEFLFVLLLKEGNLFLGHFASGHSESIVQVLLLDLHDFCLSCLELIVHEVLLTLHRSVQVVLHQVELILIFSDDSQLGTFNFFFLLLLELCDLLIRSLVNTFDHLVADFLDCLLCRELLHDRDDLCTFSTVLLGNQLLAFFKECGLLLLAEG